MNHLSTGSTLQNLSPSNLALAYLGDAQYELWCRRYILSMNYNAAKVHKYVVHLVRCQTQAQLAQHLLPFLTTEEHDVYRRGKNSRPLSCPRHASMKEYRAATGLECLIGYWSIQDHLNRFETLMNLESLQYFIKTMLLQS